PHPRHPPAPDLGLAAHRGPGRAEGAPGGARRHRHGRARHVDLRGSDRDREPALLVGDGRARRHPLPSPRRPRVGGARHGGGAARAHLRGGYEAAARPGRRAPRTGPAPPPRRAVHRARSRGAEVARRVPHGLQGARRRPGGRHPQLRRGTRRGGSGRHPRGRAPRARPSHRRARPRRPAPALRRPRPRLGDRVVSGYVRRAWVVVWKDVLSERRSKESLNALVFFSLLLLFVFQFALGPERARVETALPGLLWLGFLLAGLLAFGRTFLVERENDCWEGLVLAPG